MEREFRTTPQWPIATTPLSGDELVEIWKDGKQYYVPFSELGGIPAAHQGSHQRGGSDAVGTLDNDAYGIPYLDADGLIDSRVSDATTSVKGKVQLATDGEESATKAVTGTDARLSDARTPTAHAEQHIAGTDVISDATVSNSGLMSASDKVKADATTPAYIPTADQKAALTGSYGTPSDTNRYVTEDDIGVGVCPLESGLVPSSNLPSYVDDVLEYASQAAFPATGEPGKIYVALDVNLTFRWSGSTYVEISKSLALGTTSSTAHRGDHGVTAYNHSQKTGNPHGTKPSELSSLGTGWGTLLESDSNDRLPTSDQKAALAGTSGTPGAGNKYVTNADVRLPTAEEKAALVGSHGTPGEANPFVTTTDPRLAGGGGGDGTTDALVRAWASFFSVFSEEQPTGQTSRSWESIASHDGDLYAAVINGDIYKMDGSGVFQPTGQTSIGWYGLATHDGDLYATGSVGDIYKMDSAGIFQPTGQTSRNWRALASHDGDLYAAVPNGDIYKMDSAGIFQPTGQTSRNWRALATHDGDLYATGSVGDIYKMDGSGVFQPTGQTPKNWYALVSHDGDLYAAVNVGDIYKMDGAGIFQPTGQTSSAWNALASHDGDLYAAVFNGDIYLLTTSNPSVNISKSNYTVPVSASFPINGRKVYRRTSAYDGNPVTITPPSGATFEGRASIDMYGQYSYVKLERISATVFAIKDEKSLASFVGPVDCSSRVAEYTGDGGGATVKDRAGNGNNLTATDITYVNGKYGKEMSFNGTTSYAQASSPVIGTTGTVAVRFKRGAVGENHNLFSNFSDTLNGLVLRFPSANAIQLYTHGTGGATSYILKSSFTDISDYHSGILRITGSQIIFMLDGVDYTFAQTSEMVAGLANLTLGRRAVPASGYDYLFNGIISHFRYDSRIWTADEARAWSLNPISIDSRV